MKQNVKSIRPFIGSKNFEESRNFYKDLGFEEIILEPKLSLFTWQNINLYLQDAYVKDWVENTMIFIEVENTDDFWQYILSLDLTEKFKTIKLTPVRTIPWGKECFVHDPAGNLLHFGEFFNK